MYTFLTRIVLFFASPDSRKVAVGKMTDVVEKKWKENETWFTPPYKGSPARSETHVFLTRCGFTEEEIIEIDKELLYRLRTPE